MNIHILLIVDSGLTLNLWGNKKNKILTYINILYYNFFKCFVLHIWQCVWMLAQNKTKLASIYFSDTSCNICKKLSTSSFGFSVDASLCIKAGERHNVAWILTMYLPGLWIKNKDYFFVFGSAGIWWIIFFRKYYYLVRHGSNVTPVYYHCWPFFAVWPNPYFRAKTYPSC